MPYCVEVISAALIGQGQVSRPNADGTYTPIPYVVGAMAAPSGEACTGHVLLTQAEFLQLNHNPFALSAEQGAAVSAAVLGCWGLAWAIRAIARALDTDGDSSTT